jgi:uncharacterized protein YbaR (Trm112 family)
MAIPQDLLDILACPDCKTPVVLDGERLVCCKSDCRRAYPIRDDIPIMLIEESQALESNVWQKVMAAHPAPTGAPTVAGGSSK